MTGMMELARRMRTMGNETRIEIMHVLKHSGELSAGEIADHLNVPLRQQPVVSKHLKALRAAGIIKSRTAGRFRLYSLLDVPSQVSEAVAVLVGGNHV